MTVTPKQFLCAVVLAALLVVPLARKTESAAPSTFSGEREFAYGMGRAGDMKQLGLAFLGYSGDHGGDFPRDLWDIYPGEIDSPRMLANPADMSFDPTDMGIFERYHYFGAGLRDDVVDCTTRPLLVYPFRNGRDGPYNMTVLYVDGHVTVDRYADPGEIVRYVLKHKRGEIGNERQE